MRQNVEFRTEDGTVLRGWWYAGEGPGPRPGIVMAHGFSATKEMYLDDFAELFHEAGFDVLVYDNRNLGESDGPVPGEIDPWQQVRDYRDAITWFSGQEGVDAGRIGIWGSSYSGAHVLVVAAIDRRVRCVVSQVPLVTGLQNARRLVRSDFWEGLRAGFDADRRARLAGEAPAMIPVAFEHAPDEPAALPTQDTHDFFFGPIRDRAKTWRNEVTLRSVELFTEYEPHAYLARISPTPLLMVVATGDVLTPCDLAVSAYEQALEPKRLLLLDGGHFDAYVDEAFEISGAAQRQWFTDHLMAARPV
ncbi:alpha/beta hydrolase [Pseudonocardia sp. WMMC193]|uniref:alpha/beta hydrolase n=1 Tax=Pseudonocardia sp. WMMC193 TaxID=2911965 RepID=UPI001F3982EB|nr:alpha/beta hydrolase [Pseudonocardia sp. WMMC193]MCF7552291.1 alpha/beta hydrolase [Pseudonocardia sp. WMMC193]